VVDETSNTAPVAGKAAGGAWAGRIGAAEEASPDTNSPGDCLCLASGRGASPGAACKARASGRARIWRASSSDSSHLFERSERSERSELCDGPEDRAPQGPRSAAKGQPSEPRPGLARRLARADASMRKRTPAYAGNGPQPAPCTQRVTRVAGCAKRGGATEMNHHEAPAAPPPRGVERQSQRTVAPRRSLPAARAQPMGPRRQRRVRCLTAHQSAAIATVSANRTIVPAFRLAPSARHAMVSKPANRRSINDACSAASGR
jgi:hypothetical protein